MPAQPQTPFGDYLDRLLRDRGLSVRGFARSVGLPVGSVSTAKRKTISEQRMVEWADALQLDREQRVRFYDLACLTHAPAYLHRRWEELVIMAAKRRGQTRARRSRS